MFDINAARAGAGKVADESFIRGRILERINAKNGKQRVNAGAKPGGLDLLCVFAGVLCKNQPPAYHGSFFEHLAIGVFMFLIRDSRIPGTESR